MTEEIKEIELVLIEKFPEEFLLQNSILPYKIDEQFIYIACYKELGTTLINQIKFICGKSPKTTLVTKEKLESILNTSLCRESIYKALNTISLNSVKEENLSISYGSSPVIDIVDHMFTEAIYKESSDIHIEPQEDKVIIRFRIDGVLYKIMEISKKVYPYLNSRIKIMANLDITDKFMPQDGKIQFKIKEDKYDLRISTLPTITGEKVVIRILYKDNHSYNMQSLGFSDQVVQDILKVLKLNHGLVLVTGPTGSGKSTTLYSMISNLNLENRNVITIEDPVEYSISGISQVNVNSKIGLTFSEGLRSILRQDPDVIMVGEIRDEETAQIATRAAITGHLVFATLHTNNATDSIVRLIDMGVPKYLLADALSAIISQRLVRKLCENCRSKYVPSEVEFKVLDIAGENNLWKSHGCMGCNESGYRGRTAAYEMVTIDEGIRKQLINAKNSDDLRQYCIKNNKIITMDRCARQLILNGVTSYEEYRKIVCG